MFLFGVIADTVTVKAWTLSGWHGSPIYLDERAKGQDSNACLDFSVVWWSCEAGRRAEENDLLEDQAAGPEIELKLSSSIFTVRVILQLLLDGSSYIKLSATLAPSINVGTIKNDEILFAMPTTNYQVFNCFLATRLHQTQTPCWMAAIISDKMF